MRPKHLWQLPAVLGTEFDPEPRSGPVRRTAREWIVDVGLVFLTLATGALSWLGNAVSTPPVPTWQLVVQGGGGVLSCLALWFWRRWPVPSTVVAALVAVIAPAVSVASSINLFRTTVHRRPRVSLPLLALTLVAWQVSAVLDSVRPLPLDVWALLVVVAGAALYASASFVRARRQLLLSMVERADRAESEQLLHVERARRLERTRIAREMHDVLAHRLSLLSMHAGALEFRPDASPRDVALAAGVIRESAHQALQDLREVVGVLRESAPDDAPERPQPTLAAVGELVEESREAGMRIAFRNDVDAGAVPESMGRTTYRIVQEALTNARKHAPGAPVTLELSGSPGASLAIEARNPLRRGAAPTRIPGAGTGLVGVAERVSLAEGRLVHGPTPEGEFRLTVSLPWP
ncbi:MAG: sensor histidine kinase [Streptosporangiales bacterium]|nr:sensor histidine kinase [Streptosporangiales bacterium]